MLDPYPLSVGHIYEPRPIAIDRGQQLAKLTASGVDPDVHGDCLDLTFLGLPILDALAEPGVPLQGQVHISALHPARARLFGCQAQPARGDHGNRESCEGRSRALGIRHL